MFIRVLVEPVIGRTRGFEGAVRSISEAESTLANVVQPEKRAGFPVGGTERGAGHQESRLQMGCVMELETARVRWKKGYPEPGRSSSVSADRSAVPGIG